MEEKTTVSKIGLRYGLIIGLVMIIYSLILHITGLATNQAMGYISFALLIAAMIIAHNAFKKEGDGFMTIGQGIGIGMLMSLIGGILSSIFTYVYIKFVDTTFMDKVKELQLAEMEKKGLSDEQIDQSMKYFEKFTTPEMTFIFGIIGILIVGFLISLIVSLITKKTNPQLEI